MNISAHDPKIQWSRESARDLVARGYSYRAAARAMGVHASTVMRAVRGGAPPTRPGPPVDPATGKRVIHDRGADAEMVAANLDAPGGMAGIARELGDGWTRQRVRRAVATAQLSVAPGITGKPVETLRQIAEQMPPRAAVAMLLDEYELIAGTHQRQAELHLAGLTRQEATVYAALEAARGRPVNNDRLYSIMSAGRPDYDVDPAVTKVLICKIRRKLRDWPFRIVTVHGFGYYLEGEWK